MLRIDIPHPNGGLAMHIATLPQAAKILSLLAEQRVDSEMLQRIINSGLISLLIGRCRAPEDVNKILFNGVLGDKELDPGPIIVYNQVCEWAEKLRQYRTVSMLDRYYQELGLSRGTFGDEGCMCYQCWYKRDRGEWIVPRRWAERKQAIEKVLGCYGVTLETIEGGVVQKDKDGKFVDFVHTTKIQHIFMAADRLIRHEEMGR